MKKSVPASKKSAMCNILQIRVQLGKSTVMTFKDEQVDLKKLRRATKEHSRQQLTMQPVANSLEAGASIACSLQSPLVTLCTNPSTKSIYIANDTSVFLDF
jgi:hypothetical protein